MTHLRSCPPRLQPSGRALLFAMALTTLSGCSFITDADGDGYPGVFFFMPGTDCEDEDAAVHPGADEACDMIDTNCDGALGMLELDDDGDGWTECDGDCPELSMRDETGFGFDPASVNPDVPEVCDGIDNDCNGAADVDGQGSEADADFDGVRPCDGDCEDGEASVFPGSPEVCDGFDTDCDGALPQSESDGDGDGAMICEDDCDDFDASVHPGAPELCDAIDNNCDGTTDESQDDDDDGFDLCEGDCDDADPVTYPGAPEACDRADNDCDGALPADEADADGDAFAACEGDCDDAVSGIHPGAPELCDAIDNDCDGGVDDGFDTDGDGFTTCGGDCDDTTAAVRPGLAEGCDGLDTDCDGTIPSVEIDGDGDGDATCEGDCDDNDATRFPSAPELCDTLDNDCDGALPADEADADSDGVLICEGDCDDANADTYPGAPELCDGEDNDCDPSTDEGADSDGDGSADCADCVDDDPEIHPDADEVCDWTDNDCNGLIDDDGTDADGDGWWTNCGDCNDDGADADGDGVADGFPIKPFRTKPGEPQSTVTATWVWPLWIDLVGIHEDCSPHNSAAMWLENDEAEFTYFSLFPTGANWFTSQGYCSIGTIDGYVDELSFEDEPIFGGLARVETFAEADHVGSLFDGSYGLGEPGPPYLPTWEVWIAGRHDGANWMWEDSEGPIGPALTELPLPEPLPLVESCLVLDTQAGALLARECAVGGNRTQACEYRQ